MAKGQQRDPRREAHWRAMIARQEKSGLSVRAFCQREGLTETALYSWRRTIRQRDQERRPAGADDASAAAAFVPLVVHRPEHASTQPAIDDRPEECICIELRDGRVMRLPPSMSVERVAAIICAIEGACAIIQEGA